MPLPQSRTEWPPKALSRVAPKIAEWDAWYTGTPEALRGVYQRGMLSGNITRPSQLRGGVVGTIARFWWGRPMNPTGDQERTDQLHVPIASDVCQASADLLYAEPPTFRSPTDSIETNAWLEEQQEPVQSVMAIGAEIGAALGGRYHRVTWDRVARPNEVFLTTVDADMALPEFRWDNLIAVTFWKVVARNGNELLRHLERHELDSAGNGIVLHGLYQGDEGNLGQQIPLTDHPSTAALALSVGADGAVVEGRTPGLLVEYFPNQLPNRVWRGDILGRHLGRSDLDGVEGEMDALDETYSSLMRDVRLAKSRIFIPEYMLSSGKPGAGSVFDVDREVYVPIRSAAPEDGDAQITMNQFQIRVEDHLRVAQELTEVILRSAGYSAQTFGEGTDGMAQTATEIRSRESRSYSTRNRKIRLEKPRLSRMLHKLMLTQQSVYNTAGLEVSELPNVDFVDSLQESPLVAAQTVLALDQARAASIEVKVRTLHPDWTPDQIKTEVTAITDELSQAAAPVAVF